jgi:guanylate kinase
MKQGKLFIFSAPSGSGKTTLVRELMKRVPNLSFSISATTRPPRGQEKDKVDYYFLSLEAFKKHISQGDFAEYEEVYPGKFYGTLKSEIERVRKLGKHLVLDVDVVGGVNLKTMYGNDALSIFVTPPSIEVLKERLEKRGTDSAESIQTRMDKAAFEMEYAPKFDLAIINDDLNKAIEETESRMVQFIEL